MRLWSLHPQYLDAQGLVALWREALLAQAVLRGDTRGYRHHPQLQRFRAHPAPLRAISQYLMAVHAEAQTRGYSFDRSKIGAAGEPCILAVSEGQMEYEWVHLMAKLSARSPALYQRWKDSGAPAAHPLFEQVAGPVEPWERQDGRTSGMRAD